MKLETLEDKIRTKARNEALADARKRFADLMSKGHAGAWTEEYPYSHHQEIRRLFELYLHEVVVPQAEQEGIKQFYLAYEKLMLEFPYLGEE